MRWRSINLLHLGRIKSTAANGLPNKSAEGESFLEAQGGREIAEADKSEIELAQLQGVLINREGIEMTMEIAFRKICGTLLSASDRLPIDSPHRAMFRNALRDTLSDALKMLPSTMANRSQPTKEVYPSRIT